MTDRSAGERLQSLAARAFQVSWDKLYEEKEPSVPQGRWVSRFVAVGTLFFVVLLVVPLTLWRGGRETATVALAFAQGYSDAARLLELNSTASERVRREVERLQLFPLLDDPRDHPFPTLGPEAPTLSPSDWEASPELRREYRAYLLRWSGVFRALGNVLVEARKTGEAIRVFEYIDQSGMARDREELAGLLYGLGELYKVAGDHAKAIAVYDRMQTMRPDDPRPSHYAGWSCFEQGELDCALRYYDRALAIDSRYAKVYYNRALVHREQGRVEAFDADLAKASELTERAYDEHGNDNPRIPFTLAILHAVRKRFDRALTFLEEAFQRDQLWVFRAENERAFVALADPTNEPSHSRFQELLRRYRPAREELGTPSEPYDASFFYE